jgi:hypothetical protein
MESNITPNPQYTQLTVDVPQHRVAEFNAFFARFLAGPGSRRRGRRHERRSGGHHGRGCARRRESAKQGGPGAEVTEV